MQIKLDKSSYMAEKIRLITVISINNSASRPSTGQGSGDDHPIRGIRVKVLDPRRRHSASSGPNSRSFNARLGERLADPFQNIPIEIQASLMDKHRQPTPISFRLFDDSPRVLGE
jgi:hypothetical protein